MKHLEVRYDKDWAVIYSPTFMKYKPEEKLPYSLYKDMLIEFRRLERKLKKEGYMGWLMNTEDSNVKMKRLITRLGGKFYTKDADKYAWFFKLLQEE